RAVGRWGGRARAEGLGQGGDVVVNRTDVETHVLIGLAGLARACGCRARVSCARRTGGRGSIGRPGRTGRYARYRYHRRKRAHGAEPDRAHAPYVGMPTVPFQAPRSSEAPAPLHEPGPTSDRKSVV